MSSVFIFYPLSYRRVGWGRGGQKALFQEQLFFNRDESLQKIKTQDKGPFTAK
jgi:hypothetical protein